MTGLSGPFLSDPDADPEAKATRGNPSTSWGSFGSHSPHVIPAWASAVRAEHDTWRQSSDRVVRAMTGQADGARRLRRVVERTAPIEIRCANGHHSGYRLVLRAAADSTGTCVVPQIVRQDGGPADLVVGSAALTDAPLGRAWSVRCEHCGRWITRTPAHLMEAAVEAVLKGWRNGKLLTTRRL